MTGASAPPTVIGNGWDALDGLRPDPLPPVSVIVAHYEQPDDLRRTLRALGAQTYPSDRVEIIVVDDGSRVPPDVPEGVTLIRQDDEGFRLAAARNRGAAAASGEVLCFLDADCAPEPGYLEALTRLPALCPDAMTVGRRRHADLSALDDDAPIRDLPDDLRLDDPAWLADAYRRSGDLLHADARSYRHLIGAVLACTRTFFAETGGFDETFTTYGGEDWEWAWRCWDHGAVLAHVPAAVAWHNGPDAAARGRDAGRANDETRRLETPIPIAGSRPHALLPVAPDVAVLLHGIESATQAVIAADSVLRRLPTAVVHLDRAYDAPALADPRIRIGVTAADAPYVIEAAAPVRIESDAGLRDLLEQVGVGTRGAIEVVDDDGVLLTLSSRRVAARRARAGHGAFVDAQVPAAGVARRIRSVESSLAAYYGDWD